MWHNRLFFLFMAVFNALYVAIASLLINLIYMVWILMEGEKLLIHNIEALFSSIKSVINPSIEALKLPKLLVIESRVSSQYDILINSLWLALLVFGVFFIIFFVFFLLIEIIARRKIRFLYYIPSIAFMLYMIICFVSRMLYILNISFIFIVFFLLVIIATMFITNHYAIVSRVLRI